MFNLKTIALFECSFHFTDSKDEVPAKKEKTHRDTKNEMIENHQQKPSNTFKTVGTGMRKFDDNDDDDDDSSPSSENDSNSCQESGYHSHSSTKDHENMQKSRERDSRSTRSRSRSRPRPRFRSPFTRNGSDSNLKRRNDYSSKGIPPIKSRVFFIFVLFYFVFVNFPLFR